MLVWGIVGISHTILYGFYRWIVPCSLANKTKGCENKKCCALFISSLCTMLCSVLFLVGWYIYGATLFLTSQSKSCDKIMYNFGYWMTLIVVILVALFVFGCCLERFFSRVSGATDHRAAGQPGSGGCRLRCVLAALGGRCASESDARRTTIHRLYTPSPTHTPVARGPRARATPNTWDQAI